MLHHHIDAFRAGRAHYNSLVDEVRREAAHCNVTGLSQKNNGVSVAHYLFDYAQTIHLPSNSMQVGPLYLLALRKVGLFCVCSEGVGKQVSYSNNYQERNCKIMVFSLCFIFV